MTLTRSLALFLSGLDARHWFLFGSFQIHSWMQVSEQRRCLRPGFTSRELLRGLGCAWPPRALSQAPGSVQFLPVRMPIPAFWGCPAAWGVQESLRTSVPWGLGSCSPLCPPPSPGPGCCWATRHCSLCPQVLRGVPATLPASAIPTLSALPHALRPQEGGKGLQRGETAFVLQGSLQRLQQEGKAGRGRLPVPVPLPIPQPCCQRREVACCPWLGSRSSLFSGSPNCACEVWCPLHVTAAAVSQVQRRRHSLLAAFVSRLELLLDGGDLQKQAEVFPTTRERLRQTSSAAAPNEGKDLALA